MTESKYNFINDDIKIDIKSLPEVLQEAIGRAEQADKDNDLVSYVTYGDNIDIVAKNCCADGAITQKIWDDLLRRYVL